MRQSYRILPVYTGDVSGVCSALYELGGMVVMHDPSGCNSTYNTHDEIRWYDRDSLIFLSGLTEADAVMGGDDKFIADVADAADRYQPAFIALCNSPIPFLNGTDFDGIARQIQGRTGIPTFSVPSNGMYDYVRGAGLALEALAESLFESGNGWAGSLCGGSAGGRSDGSGPSPGRSAKGKVNILGVTPLDFAADTCAESLRSFAAGEGWEVTSVWAMGDPLKRLAAAPEADLNLVVSSVGLPAAEYLHRRFGIPWTAGVPVGAFRPVLAAAMEEVKASGNCRAAYLEALGADPSPAGERFETLAVGEAVLCGSIAAALRLKGEEAYAAAAAGTHLPDQIAPLTGADQFAVCLGEEEVEDLFRRRAAIAESRGRALRIAADPMYEWIAPEGARMVRIPQLAFSGRVYRNQFPDLMNAEIWRTLWE